MKQIIYKCDYCHKIYDSGWLRDLSYDTKHICRKCNDIHKIVTPIDEPIQEAI